MATSLDKLKNKVQIHHCAPKVLSYGEKIVKIGRVYPRIFKEICNFLTMSYLTFTNGSARTAQHARVNAAFHDTDTNIHADIFARIILCVSGDIPVQLATGITSGNHACRTCRRGCSRGCRCWCRCWCRGMRPLRGRH